MRARERVSQRTVEEAECLAWKKSKSVKTHSISHMFVPLHLVL